MKDIASLCRRAKYGGPDDRAAYTEAVKATELSEPIDYLSQLEYIICSGVGIESLGTFIERYSPLPVVAERAIFEVTDKLVNDFAGTNGRIPPKPYLERIEKARSWLDEHEYLLAMFEAFEDQLSGDYLESVFDSDVNYAQAIDRFGAAAVPDCLLGCFGGDPSTILEYAADHPVFSSPEMKQWLVEISRHLPNNRELTTITEKVGEKALIGTVEKVINRGDQAYREAVLTDQEDLEVTYTEAEIDQLQRYSDFQNYLVTALRTETSIMSAWKEACRVEERLVDLVEEESCADIAEMLPTGQRVIREARDKKTGQIPKFISKHHNLSYGEDDDVPSKPVKSGYGDIDDDYVREPAKSPATDHDVADEDDPTVTDGDKKSDQPSMTNYYYNYYNSFNRHHRDDHSSHRTDNSVNKRIRSDNVTAPKGKDSSDRADDEDDSYSEGFKDFIGKVAKGIKGLTMRKSLANLQRLDLPSESNRKQPITLLGGVPIPGQDKAMAETVELTGDPELITEAFSFFGMGKGDINQMIDRLRRKFKAEILIIEKSNPQIDQLIGPASVIETNRDSIEKLVHGNLPEFVPTVANTQDRSGFEKVILVNPALLKAFRADTPKKLEIIISHEYGHVLTFDQLTQRDWWEYMTKRQIIGSLLQAVHGFEAGNYLSSANLYYHKLKPEKLANEASRVNPVELSEAITGVKPKNSIPGLNFDAVVDWNMPELIFRHAAMAAAGKTDKIPREELIENLKISLKLYEKVVTDASKRDLIISNVEASIKMMGGKLNAAANVSNVKLEAGDVFERKPRGTEYRFGRSTNKLLVAAPDYGFNVITGEWTTDEIVKKLVEFLKSAYFEDETKVIVAVKKLAEDEHHVLGNVVMEPGLETMWTDRYHLEEMLLGPSGNIIFEADTGETILYEHIIGSNTFDPAKVTWEKLEALIDQYKMDRSILDELRRVNGDDITNWGRTEWGRVATEIFEKFTFPKLEKLELPPNCRLELYYDGTPWDDTSGARLIFTDIHDELRKFNDEISQAGKVTVNSANLLHKESVNEFDILSAPIGSPADESFLEKKQSKPPEIDPEDEDPSADPERPTSDHPVKDTIQDIDRVLTKKGAEAKKKVNDAINVGRVITKPIKRTAGWIDNLVNRLKDANETKIKEELADPHRRKTIFKAIRTAITAGALMKAGLLLNPIFLFLAVTNTVSKRRNNMRLRSDVIGQLKAEVEVTEEKIRDADRAGDNAAKYKLMRFKTELEKKLLRVGGGKEAARIL